MEGKWNERVRRLVLTKQGLGTIARTLIVALVLMGVGIGLYLLTVPIRTLQPTGVTINSASCNLSSGSSENATCAFSFSNLLQQRITVKSLNITKDSSQSTKIVQLSYTDFSLPSSGVGNFTVSFPIPKLDNITSGQSLWYSIEFNTGEGIVASMPIS